MTKAINNVQKAKDKELPNFQPEKGLNKCENSTMSNQVSNLLLQGTRIIQVSPQDYLSQGPAHSRIKSDTFVRCGRAVRLEKYHLTG